MCQATVILSQQSGRLQREKKATGDEHSLKWRGLRTRSVPTERGRFCFRVLWGCRANVSTSVWELAPPTAYGLGAMELLAVDISHTSVAAETNISRLRELEGIDAALHRCTRRKWHIWSTLCDLYNWVGCRCSCSGNSGSTHWNLQVLRNRSLQWLNKQKESAFISFLSVISYIKLSLSRHIGRIMRCDVGVIKLNLSSTKAVKVIKWKPKDNLMWRTNEDCLQLVSPSQHQVREWKVSH